MPPLPGQGVSDSEYILLLDADFAPRPDLLDETLPYLAAYPDIGIVQTPQYFHINDKQTWVERGAGAVQEMFYRSIQTARAGKGGAICCGSCAVYRRTALQDNRGMSLELRGAVLPGLGAVQRQHPVHRGWAQ